MDLILIPSDLRSDLSQFFSLCVAIYSYARGVARYLKTLFDEESGRGRKNVVIDHLVNGKSRKEASRMFFETLVRHQFCFMVLVPYFAFYPL